VGYSSIMRSWSKVVGGLAMLVSDVGARVILGYTCLDLTIVAGPRFVERGCLLGR
jgi:hypothetical protein